MNETDSKFSDQPISKLAYSSVILGFLGCVVFGPITAIPAIFIGYRSLNQIKSGSSEFSGVEKRLLKAGIFLGYLGLLITISIILALFQLYLDPHFFDNVKLF
jgi:hypothetical protein